MKIFNNEVSVMLDCHSVQHKMLRLGYLVRLSTMRKDTLQNYILNNTYEVFVVYETVVVVQVTDFEVVQHETRSPFRTIQRRNLPTN